MAASRSVRRQSRRFTYSGSLPDLVETATRFPSPRRRNRASRMSSWARYRDSQRCICTTRCLRMKTATTLKYWYQAKQGLIDPFVLVVEGSIPNEKIKSEGYWAALGSNPLTGNRLPRTSGSTVWLQRQRPSLPRALAPLMVASTRWRVILLGPWGTKLTTGYKPTTYRDEPPLRLLLERLNAGSVCETDIKSKPDHAYHRGLG